MENLALKQEANEWNINTTDLLEQLRLPNNNDFGRSSEAHLGQGELQFDEAETVEAAELPQKTNIITVLLS